MKKTPLGLILSGLSLLTTLPCPADTRELPLLVITPSRDAGPLREVQATTILIDAQTIERSQSRDLSELLRLHAGIEIGRAGGAGQQTSLFMRGTDSNHSLVMLDGVPINPGTIGNAPIQHIDPRTLERVEVVKGPASSLYGSAAIGGVINLISKKQKADGLSASITAGPDQSRDLGLGISHQGSGYHLGLDLGHFKTDGFPTRTESDIDRGHRNDSLKFTAGTRLGAIDLGFSHWQTSGKTEYLDFFLTPVDQDEKNSVTSLSASAQLSQRWQSSLRFNHFEDEILQNQSDDFLRTRRSGLDWEHDIQLSQTQQLTAGVTAAREDTASLSFGSGYAETLDTLELFVQDDLQLGDNRFTLAARHTDHETFGNAWTWNLAWGYQLRPTTRLVASAGTAFRAPDSTDLFGFGGNPDLDPERSRSVELSLRQRLTENQQLNINLFQTRIDDLIVFHDPDGFLGPIDGENANLERARINGIEVDYQLSHGPWNLGIQALFQDPKNLDTDRILARRARQNLNLSLGYATSLWDASLEVQGAGKRYDSDFSDEIMQGYLLTNISGRIHLGDHWNLQGRIENLFDRQYELASGYNTQDLALFVGISYR
jgi:vitamin B12 transporter